VPSRIRVVSYLQLARDDVLPFWHDPREGTEPIAVGAMRGQRIERRSVLFGTGQTGLGRSGTQRV
jgi:hypothetical protein